MSGAVALWGRRTLSVLLLLAFLQPACFTARTWQDDRHSQSLARVEPPQLEAYRAHLGKGGGYDVLLRVPDQVRGKLPGVPATCDWVRVQPTAYHRTVAILVVFSAMSWQMRTPLRLELVEEVDGSCAMHLSSFASNELWALRDLEGFSKGTSVLPWYSFDVPCELEALASPPELGERLVSISLDHDRMRDDGTPLLTRIALTPLALVGDVLLSPIELVWWLGY